ncbi:hypothetical protein K493DRAFT_313568 [Basidiobolus meristosporus CBS 931.73]|uniref:K Homology domain-containing protein n=1 Tax=Basidiobolus meristosporus CBS 931.73 TaxID=1314790 RepID=A0A1Y1YKU6_9FUNG|nr:hypothetical protein K493DRAFT_313568 [Basidiobolus meristosporus CBS 931.73]|eukprot:ORX98640.1 hypothetical protein K493DRAFT_313568 [Basidiobolus meristosporus CBS 931.73]
MSYRESFSPSEAVSRISKLTVDPLNHSQEPSSDATSLSNSPISRSLFEKHPPSYNPTEISNSATSPESPSNEENIKVSESQLTLRALVSTKEAGVIIGKAGKNVAELREVTGVKAGVSKVVQGVQDRVLSVTGSLDGVSKAYSMIGQTMLENPIASPPTTPLSPVQPVASGIASIRLLISHNLMGTIIGRQGTKIKQIQDISGARMVASKEMLPQSTERIVEVQGTTEAIKVAIWEIGKCLMEDWERGVGTVLYNPNARISPNYLRHSEHGSRREATRATSNDGDFGRIISQNYAADDLHLPGNQAPFLNSANMTTQQISIPSDMVGCIIGKGGSKISEIRRLSGSRISIAKVPHNETGERMFTIIGTPDSNEKALFLLYSQLEAEKEKRINAITPSGEEAPVI